jgi:hypothetical protein
MIDSSVHKRYKGTTALMQSTHQQEKDHNIGHTIIFITSHYFSNAILFILISVFSKRKQTETKGVSDHNEYRQEEEAKIMIHPG